MTEKRANIVIQFRHGNEAAWTAKNPVLRPAEPGVEDDTGRLKLGDGVTAWNDLDYSARSAYQMALDEGFVGTKEQWFASLKGDTGDFGSLEIGAVTTGAPGSQASANITGPAGDQTLDLTVPRGNVGNTGPPNSLSVGTVTTGAAGSQASAAVTGQAPAQSLDLTIPRGDKGDKGDTGDLSPVANSTTPGATPPVLAAWLPSTRTWTLNVNATVQTPESPSSTVSGTVTLVLKQPASGGPYTVTWPAALEWANDAPAPVMPTAANAELIVHLFWTGTAWRGLVGGVFFP